MRVIQKYPDIATAREATKCLKISSSREYQARYKEDPRLPPHPEKTYRQKWLSWADFLGKKDRFYPDLQTASEAAQRLKITSVREYKARYIEDPRLPSTPYRIYQQEWVGWADFLGQQVRFYPDIQTASEAAQRLKITSRKQYPARYKEDPRLPSTPYRIYQQEWVGWADFLGQEVRFYPDLQTASEEAQRLRITSSSEYRTRYKEDPRLPSNPYRVYQQEWVDWADFLGRFRFYPDLKTASEAVQRLKIASQKQYSARYKEDPRLPSAPYRVYQQEWVGWADFLGKEVRFYSDLQTASEEAQQLKITSSSEYQARYKEDPRLPSHPDITYKHQWMGWADFLGAGDRLYPDLKAASETAQRLKITSSSEYRTRYKEDPRLPSSPNHTYRHQWTGWANFLGRFRFYPDLKTASQAARRLKITSSSEYQARYKEDPRLAPTPKRTYEQEWMGWPNFLGKDTHYDNYPDIQSASEAAQRLKITTSSEYRTRYKEDPRLPSNPNKIYRQEWTNWPNFFGKETRCEPYPDIQSASKAVQRLKIASIREYNARYKEDHRLPSSPYRTYEQEWMGWSNFLDKEIRCDPYPDIQSASEAAQRLKITSSNEYRARYKEDPQLPSNPNHMYRQKRMSWVDFLLPKKVADIGSFRQACSVLGIKNSMDYRKARKVHRFLPSKPERLVGWRDWYSELNIPRPYEYGILREKVLKFGCQTLDDYKKFRMSLNDPRIPSDPIETYREWTNTFDFFGKKRPYKIRYLEPEWEAWGLLIREFLKTARGGDTKEKDLCEFVREFIEPNGLDLSPADFLTRGTVDIHPMLALLSEVPLTRKKKWLFSIKEFLDWVLATELTIEDEDTGEVHLVNEARNPFALINFDGEATLETRSETDKLALPYQFVKAAREWVFPDSFLQSTTNYNQLSHLHRFSADWVTVDDLSLIDERDPDCVVRRNGDKVEIWLPIYWTYTFALMHLPARGRQIVYCDSGEADRKVARIKNGKVIWAENNNKLAGLTESQAMVSKVGEDYGVRYTSNKTHLSGQGYSVPFIPDELVYWLIKLRNWQEKYNPISKPTAWFDCNRTNLNELQRKQKGSNCFLFRDFGEGEPGIFGSRLKNRLAAALFFSGKGDVSETRYLGLPYNEACEDTLFGFGNLSISQFNSSYTPHSLRVSLINAYAYEFGLPLEVIMKLVGHSSILMSIYYMKSDKTGANLRERLKKGEKEALRNASYTLKQHIENRRIEECKSELTANSLEFLTSLTNARPSSSYQFKDFGCCPVGGAFCSEGGDRAMTKVNIFHPVPAGYLGEQNCIRCRFFVTGPAFMMGLVALFNEISLSVHTQSLRHSKLEEDLDNIIEDIEVISHQIYEEKNNNSEMKQLQEKMQAKVAERHKLNSEIETRAKKIDLYLCDMNFVHKHIDDCRTLAKSHPISPNKKLQLVVPASFEVSMDLDDVSCFHQLSEVCENAEIYHSCSDEMAIYQRSQILDRMLINNQIEPKLMFLSEQEQLSIGNQLTELMFSRLKSWENVDKVIDGSLLLTDLDDRSRSTLRSINQLFSASNLLKIGGQSD